MDYAKHLVYWYVLLSAELLKIGLRHITSASCVFVREGVIAVCYVDELLIMTQNDEKLSKLKKYLRLKLPENKMGLAEDFLE